MSLKKNPSIKDFQHVVTWENIQLVLGQRRYNKFCKWMNGQTVPIGGVYPEDLDRFLRGLPVID